MTFDKAPIITKKENNESEEVVTKASIHLNGTQEDLREIFDYCARESNNKYPRSSTAIGEPEIDIKDGRERKRIKTIQSEYFTKIFEFLKETNFFKNGIKTFLDKYEMSLNHFITISDLLFSENFNNIKKEDLEKYSNIIIDYCDLNSLVLLPEFYFETKEEELKNGVMSKSDILINLLNNLSTRAQVALYS